jgi:hypothetical protein
LDPLSDHLTPWSTASLKGEVAAGSIFDLSLAAEAARELAQKKSRKGNGGLAFVLKFI